jgi:hypothetical protein
MNKRINFADNLFILNIRLRMIRDILSLDAAPGLFLEKTLEDLEFLDYSLAFLLRELMENQRFLEREEVFEDLSELEWLFSQTAGEFSGSRGEFSPSPGIREKLELLQNRSLERRKLIDQSLPRSESAALDPLVGAEELGELLKKF